MPDGQRRPTLAVAASLAVETVNSFLTGNSLFHDDTGNRATVQYGDTVEDFAADLRYHACLLPCPTPNRWLDALFRINCNVFVELFPNLDLGDLGPLRTSLRDDRRELVVCLSTQSAYHLPLARKFVTALRQRNIIGDDIAPSVELAVQEAFSNSVMHGNMELNTSGRFTLDKLNILADETRKRLAHPFYGGRAIIMAARHTQKGRIEISIHDQGPGFTPPDDDGTFNLPGDQSTFGRGLPLIRSLCENVRFGRGGRTIKMTFPGHAQANTNPFIANPLTPASLPRNGIGLARILVADETLISRESLAAYLKIGGFGNLAFARDGEDTLAQADWFLPDMVILDLMMPKMDGFAVCKALRADPRFADIPIIAQTALAETAGRTRILEDGATDLILKPVNKAELLARVRIHLENRLLVQQLRSYWERTRSELELARNMQERLIPRADYYRTTGAHYGLSISAHFQTSSELGGDLWGLLPLDDQRLAVWLVDFTGHGLGAALNTFRLHSLMSSDETPHDDPGAYLTALNKHLKKLLPVGQYATMLYGIIDRQDNLFRYACAATTAPVIGSAGNPDIRFLDGSGVPLGVIADARYDTREITFGCTSFLMLYSDALIETELDNGEILDPARLQTLLQKILMDPEETGDLAAILTGYFLDHTPAILQDDFTLVTLQSKPR
ncbi:MAG: SpoIIE family protein phosphatase [Pseudomonadota bacterium]